MPYNSNCKVEGRLNSEMGFELHSYHSRTASTGPPLPARLSPTGISKKKIADLHPVSNIYYAIFETEAGIHFRAAGIKSKIIYTTFIKTWTRVRG